MHIKPRHVFWFALIIAAVACAVYANEERTWQAVTLAAAPLLLLVAGAFIQVRRDPVLAARVASGCLLVAGLIFGAVAIEADRPSRVVPAAAALLFVLCAAFGYLGWIHRRRDRLPNRFLERFDPARIVEVESVQFVVMLESLPGAAACGEISVHLQSCVAAGRSVRVELDDLASGMLQSRAGLEFPRVVQCQLRPGEVGRLRIPFRWGTAAAETVRLYVAVSASGPGGKRIRSFRAQPSTNRVSRGFQLFALLGGHLVWGGGTYVELRVPPRSDDNYQGKPLGPTWEAERTGSGEAAA